MWDRLRPLVERSPGHRRRSVPNRLDENISPNLAVRQVRSDGLLFIGRTLQLISTEGDTADGIRPINVDLLRRHEEAQDQLLLAVVEHLFHMVITLNGPEVSQEELGSTADGSGISVMLFQLRGLGHRALHFVLYHVQLEAWDGCYLADLFRCKCGMSDTPAGN